MQLDDIWKADSENIETTKKFLTHYQVLPLYNRLVPLFEDLLSEVEKHLASSPTIPFIRKDLKGNDVPAWDVFMRLYLLTSAYKQFVTATSHLFRGHISPVFAPVRRAIEGAGIAYLSKSKPEIGDLFQNRNDKAFRKQTSTRKILPENDPLTAELINSINFASKQIHNNFVSFAGQLKQSLSLKDGKFDYTYDFSIHEVSSQSEGFFLNICLWTLRVAERVTLLLAASFNLPPCQWHEEHARFTQELQRLYIILQPVIFGETKGIVEE